MSGDKKTYPSAIQSVKPNIKSCCYLTFDDGPNANTGSILDALASENVKATFYLTEKKRKRGQD